MTIETIRNRRSVREYKSNPVANEDITEIIKAAQFAPAAHDVRAIEFVVIKDEKTKEQLFEITSAWLSQEFLKNAPVLLIPAADTKKSVLPVQDLSVASENIFLEAASRELGTVWKNVPSDHAPKIKKLLGIPENYTLINIIPIGYPKITPEPKSDSDFDPGKIHLEKW